MKFYVKTKLSENISETPEGFLLCKNVPLTHTGSLRYSAGEHPFGAEVGDVVIKRSSDELFSPATMSSFEGKDITVQHPEEFVNPDNFQELTNGHMFNLRKSPTTIDVEGENVEVLLADFLIKSSEAIQMVKDGEREVSLGYDAFWELVSANEGRHTKIVGNHCALVSAGRAGKHCAINDHKKENELMGMKELEDKFKKIFKGKSIDEAMKEEEQKAKDAEEAAAKEKADKEAKEAKDAEEVEKAKKDKESKDSDLEAKVEKLTQIVEALLKKMSGEDEEEESKDGDDESEEVVADEDEEDSEEDESEDSNLEGMEGEDSDDEDDKPVKKKAGDTMSCAEILAPGIEKSANVISLALAKAYKTADGKKAIDKLTGGKGLKGLTKDSEKTVFVAAAEMLKQKRVNDFASQRITTIDSFPALKGTGQKSAEDINKQNAEFYNKKK